jgi:hypothetical protein
VVGRVLTERDAGWDVGLITRNKERSVAVRLRGDGTVEVGSFWAPPMVAMLGPIRHPIIKPGNEDNAVLVILRGGQTLEIYVNGTAICQPITLRERLGPVCPGVGLWERCAHPELKGRAVFNSFKVWRLSP